MDNIMETEMTAYRKDMVKLLTGLARFVNEMTDNHKDFTVYGYLPAYSDEYDKDNWTDQQFPQYSIEVLADRFCDEVQTIIKNKELKIKDLHKLKKVLNIIEYIDWSEI